MDALEWITTREPRPPAALVARMGRALGENGAQGESSVSSQLLTAAAGILARSDSSSASEPVVMNATGPRASVRSAAVDLLAADALITYAMEYASGDCGSVEAVADGAMRAICELR